MKVGIIVLNWNGKSDTIACLESLTNCEWESRCLLVVDNGSTDGSVDAILCWGTMQGWQVHVLDQTTMREGQQDEQSDVFSPKQLFILRLEENRGYTGGNNAGISWLLQHRADAVLILNNDTSVSSDTVPIMRFTMEQRKDVGIVGCRIVSYDGEKVFYQGGNRSYWLGVHNLKALKGSPSGIVKVNFVPGCAMLVRASVLRVVGQLREDFFLYTDDTEFCHRVRLAGWTILANLDAVVRAKVAASSGGRRSAIYYYFITRNTSIFILEELRGLQRLVAFTTFCMARIMQILLWVLTRRWDRIQGVIKGFVDFLSGVRGPGWAAQYLKSQEVVKASLDEKKIKGRCL